MDEISTVDQLTLSQFGPIFILIDFRETVDISNVNVAFEGIKLKHILLKSLVLCCLRSIAVHRITLYGVCLSGRPFVRLSVYPVVTLS